MSSRYIVSYILQDMTQKLKSADVPNPAREAQLLLMHFLDKDELWLITNQQTSVANVENLYTLLQRRMSHEPLEYITSKVSFYGEEFYIAKGALIPRPETEILIDEVKKRVSKESRVTFVEVGVGSGIISIMLAKHFYNAKFIAIDISQDALDIAKINIEKFQLQKQIELRKGSLLDEVKEHIDYLVSNPPYIEDGIALEKNLSYEPQNALFGGEVSDEIIKALLDEVLKRKIKYFSCEMGYDQKDKITSYLKDKHYKSLTFYKDWSDFDRGFSLELV